MSTKAIKFNVDNLRPFLKAGKPITLKDTEVAGLKFIIRKSRCAFTYDKRVSGQKGSALTFSLKPEIGAHNSVNYKDAREWAGKLKRLCEAGIDPREDKLGRELLSLKPLPEKQSKDPSSDGLLMEDAIRIFFSKKTTVKPNTLKGFEKNINKDFCPSWLKMDLRSITPAMIAAQFALRHGQGARSPAWEMLYTFSNLWNTNRKSFKNKAGEKILGPSPIPEVRQIIKEEYGIKRHKPKRMVIKNHQLGKFFVQLDQILNGSLPAPWLDKDGTVPPHVIKTIQLTQLSLITGLRFCEARFLKWDYVDLEAGYFQLPGSIQRLTKKSKAVFDGFDEAGKVVLNLDEFDFDFSGTKNGESHFVPLSSFGWDLLRRLHAERSDNPFVFASATDLSRPIKRHDSVFQFLQRLGFEYSPHAARRTFASIANDVGIGFLDIKEMLNHVSQSDVTSGYIVPGFNPTKNRHNFQKVCDHILNKAEEYRNPCAKEAESRDIAAFSELQSLVTRLGLTPTDVVHLLLAPNNPKEKTA